MIEEAKELARKVHEGQKYGDNDYFDYHLEGVAEIARQNSRDPLVEAVTYLHDVYEDAPEESKNWVLKQLDNFHPLVKESVLILSHTEGDYAEYIDRIFYTGIPRRVKLADLTFNIRESEKKDRLNGYEKQRLQKYKLAKMYLQSSR